MIIDDLDAIRRKCSVRDKGILEAFDSLRCSDSKRETIALSSMPNSTYQSIRLSVYRIINDRCSAFGKTFVLLKLGQISWMIYSIDWPLGDLRKVLCLGRNDELFA